MLWLELFQVLTRVIKSNSNWSLLKPMLPANSRTKFWQESWNNSPKVLQKPSCRIPNYPTTSSLTHQCWFQSTAYGTRISCNKPAETCHKMINHTHWFGGASECASKYTFVTPRPHKKLRTNQWLPINHVRSAYLPFPGCALNLQETMICGHMWKWRTSS